MTGRDPQNGVVLINVLVVLAISSSLMFLLISSQEAALERVSRANDAAIAERIALGAEASVVAALYRDLETAPDIDHFKEPWALGVIQDEVQLPTGLFSVQISDLQAKYNINDLANITLASQGFARRLMVALDQPAQMADRIARVMSVVGAVARLQDLGAFGIPPETLAALEPYVTALPVEGTINLNSADPFLLQVMLANPGRASRLVRQRDRKGFLTREDLNDAGVLRPQNSGFTSNAFRVDILAEAGDARIRMQSLIVRRNQLGIKAVDVIQRRFVHDAPPDE